MAKIVASKAAKEVIKKVVKKASKKAGKKVAKRSVKKVSKRVKATDKAKSTTSKATTITTMTCRGICPPIGPYTPGRVVDQAGRGTFGYSCGLVGVKPNDELVSKKPGPQMKQCLLNLKILAE